VKSTELLAIAEDALARAGEAEAEVYARASLRGFARFAVGELGSHMDLSDESVVVRVANGARVAQAVTSRLDARAIADAIGRAAKAARFVPETEGFPGFAGPDPAGAGDDAPSRWAARTAEASPDERADRVGAILAQIASEGLVGAGVLETSRTHAAVATTRGARRAFDGTLATFKVWALETAGAGGAAGYGGRMHTDLGALDLQGETERAIRVAKLGKAPVAVDAGVYDVVLEPPAVAELLEWLAAIAFGAPDVEQGTSPMTGRAGERVTGEAVTIVEDPLDASEFGVACPFDREGTRRARVPLVERGIAREILHDRTTAARCQGARSTGSALVDENGAGSVGPTALAMEGGDAASVEELLAGVTRGLYICRLHYVNGLLEPRRAVMTGLSRDGCFLVEHGKIARPVGNVRFTDSFLEGLARADGMTRARTAVPTWWSAGGSVVAPAIRVRGFHISGGSARIDSG
jgi:predicted Zn-dependent protease